MTKRGATPDPDREDPKPRRRIEEIRADLDAITAEFERIHGRRLLPSETSSERRVRERRKRRAG